MATPAERTWFTEAFDTRVRHIYQADGNFLDGTMTTGHLEAGKYRFPVFGRLEAYKLTGAIQDVNASRAHLGTIDVEPDDYEVSSWIYTPDLYKMHANLREHYAQAQAKAIGRKADDIRLGALRAFKTAQPAKVETIGDGSTVIDLPDLSQAIGTLIGGNVYDEVFCAIPSMWNEQLKYYKEWSSSEFVGPADMPFSKKTNVQKRTFNGVHFFTLPNEYFGVRPEVAPPASIKTYMWAKDAMASEVPIKEDVSRFSQHPEKEGDPWLAKARISGCAVGLMPEGVKELHFKWLTKPVRPAA